jgi:uncharacterized protein (DUF2062 family)
MIKKLERRFKYLIIKLLRIHDKAHSIAIGFSLGLLINFVPSFGFGPVLSVAFAKLFRGNTVAGFLGGISLIWAFPVLFYLNLLAGDIFLSLEATEILGGISDSEDALEAGLHIGKAFFVGMFINMFIVGTIIYFSVYALITKYRKKLLMYIYRVWLPQK